MFGRLIISSHFLRKMLNNLHQRSLLIPLLKLTRTNPSNKIFLLTSSALFTREAMQNVDLNLRKACDEGEAALIKLIDELRDQILELFKEYQDCLNKEIEIIRAASEMGPLSNKWDDLPEYRSLAIGLSQDLNYLTATIHTIGQMVHKESMNYITDQKQCINLISSKFKELEVLIQKQNEDIKKLEAKVLAVKRESILMA